MAITEDGSSPGATTGTGTSPNITSASFTPPAGRLLLAMVSGEWTYGTITPVVTDSRGGTWQLMSICRGTGQAYGVAAVYCRWVATSAAMTVTAQLSGLGGGRYLDVRVLNGADPVQSPSTGWTRMTTASYLNTANMDITTSVTGAVVYGVSDAPLNNNTMTAFAGSTMIGQHANIVDHTCAASWKYVVAAPGLVTVGGIWTTAGPGNIAALEVIPLGGGSASPTMPTFIDGMVPRAADLNALSLNIRNLFAVAGGGARYAPYVPGGKGPIKPLTVLGVTNPSFGVGNNSSTFMVWDTPYVNSDNAWSPLAPSIIQINTPGLYRIHFQVQLLSVNPADIETFILVNGTNLANYAVSWANSYGTACGCSCSIRLAQGSYAYAGVLQYSGGNATMGATQFVAEYLGA